MVDNLPVEQRSFVYAKRSAETKQNQQPEEEFLHIHRKLSRMFSTLSAERR